MIADVAHGHTDGADICFLIAVILFLIYAFVAFADKVKPVFHSVLLGLGLAFLALGYLIL